MHNQNQMLLGVLSYLGPLVIIPFLVEKEDAFVKFHIKQGVVLLVIEIILWLTMTIFWLLMPVVGLLQLGVFVLMIIGIFNVAQKKEKELPVVGAFAHMVNI